MIVKTTISREAASAASTVAASIVGTIRARFGPDSSIDAWHVHTGRELLAELEHAPGARRQPLKLRMAKARARSELR